MCFSVTVLRERTGRSEDKRIEDSWDWEVLNKPCLIPSKFIKKYNILYTIPKGEILSQQNLSYEGTKSVGS